MADQMVTELKDALPNFDYLLNFDYEKQVYRLHTSAKTLTKKAIYDFIAVFQEHGYDMKSIGIAEDGLYFDLVVS